MWDGDVLLAENRDSQKPTEYVHEGFVPLAKIKDSQVEIYHTDYLGTPKEVTDEQGEIIWQGNYDEYGKVVAVNNQTEQNIRFQGQYKDEETGLFYNRFRYYDADGCRYINEDSIRLLGGINLCAYVRNPLNRVDRFGLYDEWETGRMGSTGHSNDGLDAHELLQSAWMKENHPGYEGRSKGIGRDNPAIAIDPQVHKQVTAAQKSAGLHDRNVLANQTARQNINANAKILEAEMIKTGMSSAEAKQRIKDMKKEANKYAKDNGC